MNKICFCLPARLKSTRLPDKLLLKFDNECCIEKTIKQVMKSKFFKDNIYVLTDSEEIKDIISYLPVNIIKTNGYYKNGTSRISSHLDKLKNFNIIVNIQSDEPYIAYENIDYAIEKHLEFGINSNIYYTTLHECDNNIEYLNSTASLKVITDNDNNVMYYSRNIIPWNKNNTVNMNYTYKTFTGIYVFNKELLLNYNNLKSSLIQDEEDCEQLLILSNSYKIKSYKTIKFNEISLNTQKDYEFLLKKYCSNNTTSNINTIRKNTENNNVNYKIKMVVFDLDGVFTDGKIYVSETKQYKCYNGKDTYGLKLLKNNNIITGLITAHNTPIIENMDHLVSRIDYISKGNYNKLEVLNTWLESISIPFNQVAYIGDDIPDLEVIKRVGFSACPNNAIEIVKDNVSYICKNNGGDGAVREFIELIINNYI
jgi:YrbI family 3-deoxy-D-manno-octulosonate 8-phosphate phosphatase